MKELTSFGELERLQAQRDLHYAQLLEIALAAEQFRWKMNEYILAVQASNSIDPIKERDAALEAEMDYCTKMNTAIRSGAITGGLPR
jgi:hypothetical protein